MNILLVLFVLFSLAYATMLYNRHNIDMLKSLAVGILSPLIILVSLVSIVYLLMGIHIQLVIATYSDESETGPTEKDRGDK